LTSIRALEREDLPAISALWADFVDWDPIESMPGLVRFFTRILIENPFADPEIPSLVYEEPHDGVVGLISSHPRRFVFEERAVRAACFGPLIVHRNHRGKGLATQLLQRFVEGPQDMTFNDRTIDQVHAIWGQIGGITDTTASIGWTCVLAPAGYVAGVISRRTLGRHKPPAGALLAMVDAPARRRLHPSPSSGTIEPLTNDALLDLLPLLQRQFPLRPAYDDVYLSWLFPTMEAVDLGDHLVRRLVLAEDGRPAGAYIMYVSVHGKAYVMQIAAAAEDIGLVLDHLMHDAATQGAVDIRGRVEPYLLPHLRMRRCRFVREDWVGVQARDPALVSAVLSGQALVTRVDGEWWMRPRAQLT
jgi:GNAT superfamily N-acetyltransferase